MYRQQIEETTGKDLVAHAFLFGMLGMLLAAIATVFGKILTLLSFGAFRSRGSLDEGLERSLSRDSDIPASVKAEEGVEGLEDYRRMLEDALMSKGWSRATARAASLTRLEMDASDLVELTVQVRLHVALDGEAMVVRYLENSHGLIDDGKMDIAKEMVAMGADSCLGDVLSWEGYGRDQWERAIEFHDVYSYSWRESVRKSKGAA